MKLFCAVDILGGRCVRLRQGDYNAETTYGADPVQMAVTMAGQGAHWIHVVDLDGARTGNAENAPIVADIAAAVDVPVQAGGGVRTVAAAQAWFDAGVSRVVMGTAAMRDPELVQQLAADHRVAVGLDARGGEVATDGWLNPSGRSVLEAARRFADSGAEALVVTDIARDGMLVGPDRSGLAAVLDATTGSDIDVVASGGVAALSDLQHLAQLRGGADETRGLAGVIVGKALYERRFGVTQAVTAIDAALSPARSSARSSASSPALNSEESQ